MMSDLVGYCEDLGFYSAVEITGFEQGAKYELAYVLKGSLRLCVENRLLENRTKVGRPVCRLLQ